ncbi:hypothetical protein [Microbacterium sp. MYb64]|uniref:hypothetical protein n=1 Tax=Microbacterium sp. MYb64 TaxID=1848691 RepID=UPI000CFDE893|nr:hypothetical protein [Microbacterium sp. MYb64]PRB02105.1 hypothetical protein CQ044_15885 [Microbacterium sp. MYb64]
MTDETTIAARRLPRRTILKTTAWSIPVVAAAAAMPLAAASVAADLVLAPQPVGEGITGTSPDGLSNYQLGWTSRYTASTSGAVATPAGAMIAISFDSRVFAAANASSGPVSLVLASSSTTGNVTTAMFTVPDPIPASGGSIVITIGFDAGGAPTPPWYTDVQPITVSLLPPSGYTDAIPANNTHTFSPVYS